MALSTIQNNSFADTAVHGRRNLIINGAANVQQRGASTTASGAYGKADRFRHEAGGGTTTLDAGTTSSSDTPYGLGLRNTVKITNTTAGSAATTDYAGIHQRIEAQNIAQSGWDYTSSSSYVTFSFWAKSSLAGDYQINLRSQDGTQQNYNSEFTLVADTWKKINVTIPGNSSIQINDDTGSGMNVYIWAYLGTNYTTSSYSLDNWVAYSGTDQGKDFPQNWKASANATFEVTGVQLELGDTATPFEHRSYGDELAGCERYFQVYAANGNNNYITTGRNHSSSQSIHSLAFKTTMRANPTLSTNGIAIFDGSTRTVSSTSVNGSSLSACGINLYSTGMTANLPAQTYFTDTSNGYIRLDAEL